jgi:alkane 1-monooxygenase
LAVSMRSDLAFWPLLGACISVGSHGGASAMVVAHELMHRKGRWEQLGAYILLLTCNYTHYALEHVHIHHRKVGTAEDPATARADENPYAFFVRCTLGQFFDAWRYAIEKHKAQSGGRSFTYLQILTIWAGVNVAWVAILFLVFGPVALGAFALQGFTAIFLLNNVNYVEHWGLHRGPGEKVAPWHNWDTSSLWTRYTLFDLGMHSDHHTKASKPYSLLEEKSGAMQMPLGLYGVTILALVPPLFRRVMVPALRAQRRGEEMPLQRVHQLS